MVEKGSLCKDVGQRRIGSGRTERLRGGRGSEDEEEEEEAAQRMKRLRGGRGSEDERMSVRRVRAQGLGVFAGVGMNVLLVALLAQVCFSVPRPDPDCQRFRGMASAAHQLHQVSIKLLRAMRAELGPVEMDDDRLEHLPAMNFSIGHLCTLTLNESLYELYCGSSLFKLSVDWLDSVREPGRQSLLNQTSVHLTRLVGMTGNALKRLQQEVPPHTGPLPSGRPSHKLQRASTTPSKSRRAEALLRLVQETAA
ncbi:unnamed protein product [Boreogadus saida]